MTTATVADPRTEAVREAADDVDHIFCADCWVPGIPVLCLCGAYDYGFPCPEDCDIHPTCPLCEIEWRRHDRVCGR